MNDDVSPHDPGRKIDWGKTSDDYAVYRPGYPAAFWEKIDALGIGGEGQDVLDLATGTGVMARHFASCGANVTGVDVAEGQIEMARQLAIKESLEIDFCVRPAEASGVPEASCDLICAAQSFLYFDKVRVVPEIIRMLKPGGRMMTSYLSWVPREDPIAAASEALVLEYNPAWSAANWDGRIGSSESWSEEKFEVESRIVFDDSMPFTIESWCGRFRACRGIGATLSPEEIAAFDKAHAELLREIAGEKFTVLHRIAAFIYRLRE